MAFFQKAKRDSLPPADSILCPVCNEEYMDEPKQLPCLHTICQDCLNDTAPKNTLKIFCPIDNQELPLPMGGIAMLPTDYRVLRHLESKRGQKNTMTAERKPRELRKEKAERTERRKSKNTDEESAPPLEEQEKRMKKQVAEMTEKMRKLLDEKEKEIYKKIDEAIGREKRSLSANGGADEDRKPAAIFLLDLTPSRKVMQSIKEEGLATIQGNRKAPTLLSDLNTAGVTPIASVQAPPPSPTYRDAADVIRALNVPLQFKSMFNPGAVAVGKNGHIAVTDYGNECVWLFNPEGSFLCQVSEQVSLTIQKQIVMTISFLFRIRKTRETLGREESGLEGTPLSMLLKSARPQRQTDLWCRAASLLNREPHHAVKDFNSLSQIIRDSDNVNIYKRQVFHFLINSM